MTDKFKAGDEVIILGFHNTRRLHGVAGKMDDLVGETLTIKSIRPHKYYSTSVWITFEGAMQEEYAYDLRDLERAEDPQEEEEISSEELIEQFWDDFFFRCSGEKPDLDSLEEELEEEDLEELEEEQPQQVILIITDDSITMTLDGDTDIATIDHPSFEDIVELAKEGKYKQAQSLMNVSTGISNWGSGLLSIENDTVIYAGMTLTGKLVDKIIGMMGKGDEEFERFAKFLNLVMEQESYQTRNRLMDFVAAEEIKLTEEGHVIAFKNVREDYYDKHSGTFLNKVGETPSMPRSMVDDDHNNQCSQGLHICSPNYLRSFWGKNGRNLLVHVNPKNFIGLPYDYADSKARVCEYYVAEDITGREKEYGF